MVRLIGTLVGAGFILVLLISLITGASTYIAHPPVETVEHEFHLEPRAVAFQSDGPFGTFNRQQLQRGLQVYKEVCAACHEIGRASCRERVCQYVEITVGAVALPRKNDQTKTTT